MTYYQLLCEYCKGPIGVYSDEVYPLHPHGVFCDGCCWNRHPHSEAPVKP